MFALLTIVFVDLVGFGVVIPLMPFYAEHYGASPLTVTALAATFSALQLFAAPLWGRLSDRIGRRPVLVVSLVSSVLAYLWLGVADALWMLFAARALQGASAGNISVAQAYVADLTTPETRAKRMGMLGAAFGFGFVVGPWLGGWLAGSDPHFANVALPAFAAAGLSALALLGALALVPESLPPERRRRAGAAQQGRIAGAIDAFARPRLRRLMVLFFIVTFAFSGMEAVFALWAEHRFQWGPFQVGLLFCLVGLIIVLVQGGLIGKLTRRFGEARLLIAGIVAIALGLAVIAVARVEVMAALGSALLAFGMGLVQPSITTLVSVEAGGTEQGEILGVNQSVGSLARVLGPVLAGWLFGAAGAEAPFVAGAVLMLAAALLAGRVPRRPLRPAAPAAAAPQTR